MRVALFLTVAAAVFAFPAGLAAEPPRDFVTGAGWVAFTDFPSPGITTEEQDVVSAHADADGSNASGSMLLHSPFGDQRANVTCLRVTGDVAIVGGRITSGFTYLGLSVSHLTFLIKDQGEGSQDLASGYIFITRPPEFDPCTPVSAAPIPFEVVRGNFVVNDA